MKRNGYLRNFILTAFIFLFFCIYCGAGEALAGKGLTAFKSGRLYTQWLYEERYELIWSKLSADLKDLYGDVDAFGAYWNGVMQQQIGKEVSIRKERVLAIDTSGFYERAAVFSQAPVPVAFLWGLDPAQNIHYLEYRGLPPEAASPYLDYRTRTCLTLPFKGTWYVLWGGRSILDNYHASAVDQRFACDFVVFKKGFMYAGDGKKNEDYYCFGKRIIAPGAGLVVEAVNDVPDNPPGSADNLEAPLGNHVIIDHQNGEYSFLCHFMQGSVTVRVGDRIAAGRILGLCGNSGASDIPHLHYHLQNSPQPWTGEGLPAQFRKYFADKKTVRRGEPVRGQKVGDKQAAGVCFQYTDQEVDIF